MRKTVTPRSAPGVMVLDGGDPANRHFSSAAVFPAIAALFAIFVFISSTLGLFRVDAFTATVQGATAGSAVIVTPESTNALHTGQWMSFTPPANKNIVIRQVSDIRHALGRTVATVGSEQLVVPRKVWTAKLSIPFVGWPVAAVRIAAVQVLILLLIAALVASMIRSLILRKQS